ncbi:hypothetical protein LZ31DRAFT_599214 [Colletotrichum somersetense]|nr:hypothetical protein LZ31DRAFT_599214 [Colletotrichum somersetense]
MSTNDAAHLAAMGLPAPAPQAPASPLPGTPAARANALVITVLEANETPESYQRGRVDEGFALLGQPAMPNDRAFALQNAHRHWVALQIQSGQLPRRKLEILARRAERAANFAIRQAEARAYVLGRWKYAYFTLRSRRRHEGLAESARQDAIGWARVSQMLWSGARAASTRARFGL